MSPTKMSDCGRFVVVDGLHLDRNVFVSLSRWAGDRGLSIQDAIQLAVCALEDSGATLGAPQLPDPAPTPASSRRVLVRPPAVDRID